MNLNKLLLNVESPYLKTGIPEFRPGDTVKVHVKVVEGESERVQPFEGVVIARRGSGISETFSVRKVSFGIGVERTFPVHSPRIVNIELMKSGKARRAKLFYLRKLSGKAARLEEKEVDQSAPKAKSAHEPKKTSPEPALSTTH